MKIAIITEESGMKFVESRIPRRKKIKKGIDISTSKELNELRNAHKLHKFPSDDIQNEEKYLSICDRLRISD